MNEPLHFEDLQIGDNWTSRSRTITETDVVNFAGLSGDYDPLHMDHEYAQQTPFGKPIAHGLLGLAWVAGLSSQAPAVNTLAFVALKDWRFLAPAYIGDTVHAVTEVSELHPNGRRSGRVIWRRKLINSRGDVLQAGMFETLVNLKHPLRRKDAPQKAARGPHAAIRERVKQPVASDRAVNDEKP